ncbi:hypothetical protein LTR92_011526, partial [Exophiala xenobiotica]
PTNGEETGEGGVKKNKEREAEEEEVEQEEVEQEEVEQEEVEQEEVEQEEVEQEEVEQEEVEQEEVEEEAEDDSINRALRARNSRRAPVLPTTRLSRKRTQVDTPTRTLNKKLKLHDADKLET